MDEDGLELLLHFVIRQKRFLRTLETSFKPIELDAGRKVLKNALRAARKERSRLGVKEFREKIMTPGGRAKLAESVVREGGPMNKKQACLLLENFELFNQVLGNGSPPPVKRALEFEGLPLCTAVDRYYSPVARFYK